MSDDISKEVAQLAEALTQVAESQAETTRLIADELDRARAWHLILNLLTARYYLTKDDPLGLAAHDCAFLADLQRRHGDSEDTAAAVEETYKALTTLIEAGLRERGDAPPDGTEPPLESLDWSEIIG
jgi:small-conductance mechanosensitive channel